MEARDMIWTLMGAGVLSVLHALIPSHWLPIMAMSRSGNWTLARTTRVTLLSGSAHVASTVLMGGLIGLTGKGLAAHITGFTHFVTPLILMTLGIYFIYRHHRHQHFHVDAPVHQKGDRKMIAALATAMFFSPCIEIEGLFLTAGAHGWKYVAWLALLYGVITLAGMILWIRIAYRQAVKLNWHSIEHNAGIITGTTLILTGLISLFIH